MVRGISLAILLLVVLASGAARAAEAKFAVDIGTQYDSNVFSTPTHLVDDVSIRPSVDVELKADPSSDFQWSLMYRPTYEAYVDTSGINGFDHLARINGDYHLSAATDVYVHEQFQRVLNLVDRFQSLQPDQGGLGQPALIFGRHAVTLNDVQAGVVHNFSPRLQSTFNLYNSLYFPQQSNISDTSTTGASDDLIYALTRTDRIGSSLAITYQQLSSTAFQPRTSTWYYQLMGIWIHDFSPTLQLDMRAGPVWVDPSKLNLIIPQQVDTVPTAIFGKETFPVDATQCPTQGGAIIVTSQCGVIGIPLTETQKTFAHIATPVTSVAGVPSGNNGGLTYFAAVSLTKTWERWNASLTYQRTTGASSSFNQSTILDTVQGAVGWHPSELWNVALSASWSRRTSASDQSVPVTVIQPIGANGLGFDPDTAIATGEIRTIKFHDAVDVDSWLAYLRVDRHISKRASVFGLLMFINQNDRGQFASAADFTDYRAQVGFRYEFDPLPLAL